jgi:capsular polysaccharide biosynthesis protein
MEPITIQVDADVAKAYREADPTERQKIQTLVNTWLKQIMKRRCLDDIITEMQNQATTKGLTQDILDEILKDA